MTSEATKLQPISVSKEHLERVRRAVYGVFADYTDPEWGVPLMKFYGYTVAVWAPGYIQRIRPLPVDPRDIYVTSFPKSGTTWMQHIVWYLVTQSFDQEESIDWRFPELEIPPPYPPKPENLDAIIKSREPPLLWKSHYPYEFMPCDILKGKLIYVYRNPKDTIVSNFHHCRAMIPQCFPGTFEQFFDMFLRADAWFSPWWKHVKGYYKASVANPSSVLLISYEDMKRDRMGIIKKVANFIGKGDLPEEMFQKICDATSFEAMKKNDTGNYSWLVEMGLWDPQLQPFIRKGVVGDWKNWFTPELEARLDEYLATNLGDCDLKFVDSQ